MTAKGTEMFENLLGKWMHIIQKTRPIVDGELVNYNDAGIMIVTIEGVTMYISTSNIIEITVIDKPVS